MSDDLASSANAVHLEYPRKTASDTPQTRANKLVAWAKNNLHYTSLYRMRRWALWRLADMFFDGDQNGIMPEQIGYAGYELARLFTPDEIYLGDDMPPRPVLNEFKDHILNEGARLDKSDYDPTVRAEGDDPSYDQRVGAKVATRVLRTELAEQGWDSLKRVAAMHMPLYGGTWMMSRWETSLEDTVRVPAEGCAECPACGCRYAGPSGSPGGDDACASCQDHEQSRPPTPDEMMARTQELPDEAIPPEGAQAHPDVVSQVTAPVLERLPGGPKLQPFVPIDEELTSLDALQRPLGQDVPRGSWKLHVLWPGHVFEEDFGIGNNGERVVKGVTVVTVRSLEYLRARYPNARTDKLAPENSQALVDFHPIGGELSNGDERLLWRCHAREIMRIKLPWVEQVYDDQGQAVLTGPQKDQPTWKLNRGRVTTVAHGIVMEDADLMIDGPDGKAFPRILVTYTPHDINCGGQSREGSSLARQLMDAQRWINWSAAMDVDEQRNGQSRWLAADASDIHFDHPDGNSMAVVRYRIPEGVDAAAYRPELVSRPTADMKWGGAAQYAQGFMERTSRKTEVEGGNIPGQAPAQALQIAREESGEIRRPRVKALGGNYERLMRHGLQLLQHYVHEPRVAWDKTDSEQEFQIWWQGSDFQGQTNVRIDVAGAEDSEVLKQEKYNDAMERGLVDTLNDGRARRIMGKLKGVPSEIYEAENAQDVLAEREFMDFTRDVKSRAGAMQLRFGPAPVVDDGLDDHEAHIYRHRKDLHGDLWHEVEKAVQWDTVLPLLAQWKGVVIQKMSAPIAPMLPAAGLDALQPSPQVYVLNLWLMLLEQSGVPVTPELQGCLEMRAHLVDHELRARMAMMPPQQPAMPAPADPAAEGAAAPAAAPPNGG